MRPVIWGLIGFGGGLLALNWTRTGERNPGGIRALEAVAAQLGKGLLQGMALGFGVILANKTFEAATGTKGLGKRTLQELKDEPGGRI